MQKIMFNDKYGLTQAVLEGRKTMTRRIVKDGTPLGNWEETEKYAKYKIGEVVAVAQSYKDLGYTKEWVEQNIKPNPNAKWIDSFEKEYPGWNNKMFVKAGFTSHQIRITDIKLERLQDISEEDCLKEGVLRREIRPFVTIEIRYQVPKTTIYKDTPREAFASLIDKVNGKGTWEENPWVCVYSFELVK